MAPSNLPLISLISSIKLFSALEARAARRLSPIKVVVATKVSILAHGQAVASLQRAIANTTGGHIYHLKGNIIVAIQHHVIIKGIFNFETLKKRWPPRYGREYLPAVGQLLILVIEHLIYTRQPHRHDGFHRQSMILDGQRYSETRRAR